MFYVISLSLVGKLSSVFRPLHSNRKKGVERQRGSRNFPGETLCEVSRWNLEKTMTKLVATLVGLKWPSRNRLVGRPPQPQVG